MFLFNIVQSLVLILSSWSTFSFVFDGIRNILLYIRISLLTSAFLTVHVPEGYVAIEKTNVDARRSLVVLGISESFQIFVSLAVADLAIIGRRLIFS